MTTHPHPVDHPADRSVHRRRRHPTASYADRLAAMKDRDAQVCTCGHRCITHGSYIDGQSSGIGQGPCGWPRCECGRFAASGAVSTGPLIPVPDYTRTNPAEDRTCPDCHAPPGEPCTGPAPPGGPEPSDKRAPTATRGPATEAGPRANRP